jgi:hypothetical protein
MIILQKTDLSGTSFSNNNTNAAGGLTIRTDASSTVGAAISSAVGNSKPLSMVHAWDPSGNGSGTLMLTFPDLSTLTCHMTALPTPSSC